jgi:hypothetical protein
MVSFGREFRPRTGALDGPVFDSRHGRFIKGSVHARCARVPLRPTRLIAGPVLLSNVPGETSVMAIFARSLNVLQVSSIP